MDRRWLALACCLGSIGCGGGKGSTPAPDSAPRGGEAAGGPAKGEAANADGEAVKAEVEGADASKGGPTPPEASPHPRLSVAPTPDMPVVVRDGAVVVLDEKGESVGTLLPSGASWCRLDPRGQVLWASGEQGLVMVDLLTDAEPVVVLSKPPETIVIAYADETLGLPAPHEFQEGVKVRMVEPPRLEAILGCDGDMVYYCIGDDAEDFDAALDELQRANAAELATQLVPEEALASIVARSKGRRAAPVDPGRAPPPTRVAIPDDGCEEAPEDCGTASVLPGTRLWQVVVGNSRGDFYHEQAQLYDPKAGEFFDPARPDARSKTPLADQEGFEPRWISPSGTLALGYDSVVSLEGGVIAEDLDGVCGLWGGGFEP